MIASDAPTACHDVRLPSRANLEEKRVHRAYIYSPRLATMGRRAVWSSSRYVDAGAVAVSEL